MTFSPFSQPTETDQELLSAYLDNQLSVTERVMLERRLEQEPALKAELGELRTVKYLMADMPSLTPPRSFTIDAATVGQRRGIPLFALLRFGSVLATVLLALTFTLDLFNGAQPSAPSSAAAPQLQEAAQATTAPAAAAAEKVPPAAAPAPDQAEGGSAASAAAAPTQGVDAVANAGGSVLNSPEAAQNARQSNSEQPELSSLAPTASAGDTSSSTTVDSALPSATTTQPSDLGLLRWTQIALAAVAVACGVGAFLAWQQRR